MQNASKANHISSTALDNYRFLRVPPHILTRLRETTGSVKCRLQNANAKPQQLKESGLPSRNYCSLFNIILPWYCLNLLGRLETWSTNYCLCSFIPIRPCVAVLPSTGVWKKLIPYSHKDLYPWQKKKTCWLSSVGSSHPQKLPINSKC